MNMKKGEKKEFSKDEIKIITTYSGEVVHYDTDFNDPDYEDGRDLYGDEIEEIEIIFPNMREPIKLSEYIPKSVTFVHSSEHGNSYNELNGRYIAFSSLIEKGGLLGILHEMGHANIIERYRGEKDDQKYEYLSERHAWGWALLFFKELKRQGKNLEPQMDEQAIKNVIKDSLLSYEVGGRFHDICNDREIRDHGFWPPAKEGDIERKVDSLYQDPSSGFAESFPDKESFKRKIRLPRK